MCYCFNAVFKLIRILFYVFVLCSVGNLFLALKMLLLASIEESMWK